MSMTVKTAAMITMLSVAKVSTLNSESRYAAAKGSVFNLEFGLY